MESGMIVAGALRGEMVEGVEMITAGDLALLLQQVQGRRDPVFSDADREELWAAAREYFLASRSASTARAYRKALDLLKEYSMKDWWKISAMDVLDWAKIQEGAGLSKGTISQRLAAVSSFYDFVRHDFSDDRLMRRDGSRMKLFDENPGDLGKTTRKQFKSNPYGKATYLTDAQVKRLLKAIRRDTVQGLRDFALFYAYISTGRRNAEIRTLRWGDVSDEGAETYVFYQWSNKGKVDQRARMSRKAWEAVLAYLEAAGRLEGMKAGDYIFTALSESAKRLVRPDGERAVSEAWSAGSAPLAGHSVNDLLKKYARRAGLKAEGLHVHILRHTKAMLHRKAGDDPQKIQKMLGHESLATTQVYIDHLEANQDDGWDRVEALFGLGSEELGPSAGRKRKNLTQQGARGAPLPETRGEVAHPRVSETIGSPLPASPGFSETRGGGGKQGC